MATGDVWRPLFPLGQLLATPGALALLEERNLKPDHLLARHVLGDWGDLDEFDQTQNELALQEGYRIFSSYKLDEHQKLWIITEADRSATTLLLPEEY